MATLSGFSREPGLGLSCDGIPLSEIADGAGTPTYVYSAAAIRASWKAFDAAFSAVPHSLHYALKSNSTLAVLRVLRDLRSRADANSVGEIEVALRAGFLPSELVFTGVGKAPAELERAVPLGLKAINVESAGELERIERLATAAGQSSRGSRRWRRPPASRCGSRSASTPTSTRKAILIFRRG